MLNFCIFTKIKNISFFKGGDIQPQQPQQLVLGGVNPSASNQQPQLQIIGSQGSTTSLPQQIVNTQTGSGNLSLPGKKNC